MANFIKQLVEHESSNKLHQYDLRQFKQIKCGSFSMSIQGSQSHYCTPRKLLDPAKYSAMEIAIFDSDGEWVLPRSDDRFKNKDWAELFEDGGSTSVAGYVPVDTIDQIIADLEFMNLAEGRYIEL